MWIQYHESVILCDTLADNRNKTPGTTKHVTAQCSLNIQTETRKLSSLQTIAQGSPSTVEMVKQNFFLSTFYYYFCPKTFNYQIHLNTTVEV